MIRAFFILWIAVFLPIMLLLIPTNFNPVQKLSRNVSEDFYKQVYSTNFELLFKLLHQAPKEQWPTIIDNYAQHFSYPLRLDDLQRYQDTPSIYHSLQQGKLTFQYDDPMALIQRVSGSDKVIYFAINEPTEMTILNQAKGTLYLLGENLQHYPRSEWKTNLDQQNRQIPVELVLLTDDDLPQAAKEKLHKTPAKIISYVSKDGHIALLSPVVPGIWLHVEDNITTQTQIKLTTAIGGFFFLCISTALVMWIYPLWRDLKRLVKTANEFGHGVLSKRATTFKLSVVSQLGDAFNKMADNVEKLIAGQRALTNAVAHDLRTPLYRLRFAFEMLEDDKIAESQKEKYRKVIHSSIEDLDHLINQTLLLSRYNRMADISHFTHCEFAQDLIQEVEHFRLEHPHFQVQVDIAESLLQHTFFIDKKALLRAVKNLLSNAARFAQKEIHIFLQDSPKFYQLVVEDDGSGIAPEQAERVFEPFTQIDNQERSSDKGHGLGLAIVRQIIYLHQGSARVVASPLGGARFELQWSKSISTTLNVTKMDTLSP
ncbi:ATP-binding protein [Vibrio metschnikovii]|uniref:ATP-binding protein n=1 Tax=Vibrio metschnikovii TaxID=28172 RepID=UPI00164B0AE3|nr:ATP-binding protein [Vibrio metschnikovii]MBC5832118.1 ATP-binding protein [Vibrio metschnikovii]